MDYAPRETKANIHEGQNELLNQVRELFDRRGYVRVRIRKRDGKETKVRNLRVLTTDKEFSSRATALLKTAGAKPTVYLIGKSYCIDIEGKARLEAFMRNIGISDEKRAELEEALKPLSLSKREGMV